MKNKLIFILIPIFILVGAYFILKDTYQKSQAEKLSFLSEAKAELFVRDYAPVKGEESAQVYVTEFLDPECESCRGIASYVNSLMSEFKGKIKLVVRYAPFHHNSIFAIKVLEAARLQGKYWETLDLLFRHQPEWGDHHHPRPELIWTYLPEVGLNIEKLKADMNNPAIEAQIEQDKKDGKELGVRGTPTFFVNGKPLKAYGPKYLREAIEGELSLE